MTKKIYKVKKDKYTNYYEHNKPIVETQNFSILPHPATLESYESLIPGITEKLAQLLVKEQNHRQKLEKQRIRSIESLHRFGQFLSAVLAIAVLYATFFMMREYNNPYLAGVICISGFSFLTLINRTKVAKNHPQHHQVNQGKNKSNA
jgi:uncharacterized membrane protein